LALPSIFNRLKFAEEDCLFLITCYEKGQLEIKKETLAEVYFNLGEVYCRKNKLEEAKKYWQKAIEICPESYFSTRAKERIEQFKQ
jgi:tetratricopeptide (TPR) repeat protein